MDKLMDESDKGYNYENVKRWLKYSGHFLSDFDKIFFPINVGNYHWTLVVVDLKQKSVSYYDSIPSSTETKHSKRYCDGALSYINDVHSRYEVAFDKSEWKIYTPKCPQQNDMSSCGVCVIANADFLSKDLLLNYEAKDLSSLRKKYALALLSYGGHTL
jgi:Ulp1 family protease